MAQMWLDRIAKLKGVHTGMERNCSMQNILYWSYLLLLGASYVLQINYIEYRCLCLTKYNKIVAVSCGYVFNACAVNNETLYVIVVCVCVCFIIRVQEFGTKRSLS